MHKILILLAMTSGIDDSITWAAATAMPGATITADPSTELHSSAMKCTEKSAPAQAADVAAELEGDILLLEREPRRRVGFLEVRERDGLGSEARAGRWRG
jgi:hypothetical protein